MGTHYVPPTQPSGISAILATSYGATFNGTTDDTAALTNALNATPAGQTLIMPTGTAKITSPLVIPPNIRVMGSSVHALSQSISSDFNSINLPTLSPYLGGTVIRQDTPATDAIQMNGVAGADLQDFGIIFGPSIIFSNTGHGINVNPPAVGGAQDNGLMFSRWQNLMVMGHDGNHYGFRIVNPICSMLTHLRAWGGGTLELINNGITSPQQAYYGNLQLDSIYGQVFCNGSAHGISTSSITNFLNLLLLNRPQVTVANLTSSFPSVTPPTSAQQNWHDDGNTRSVTMVAQDFETNVGSTISFPAANNSLTWDPNGSAPPFFSTAYPGGGGLSQWINLAQRGIFIDAVCEYRADAITGIADATAISSWPDSSGNGFTLSQGTGADQPTFYKSTAAKLINGLPAVWFDGTDDFMSNTGIPTLAQPLTMVVVGQYAAFTTNPIMLANVTPTSAVEIGASSAPLFELYAGGATFSGGVPSASATYIHVGLVNGANSSLRVNGSVQFTGNIGSNTFQGGVMLGKSPGGTQWLNGPICHVIIFPYLLTTAQCKAVEAFLTNKWA